ncbi:MAG TPA: hypothetical protein VFS92_08495 [Planctomycetota bacterium]|nr:hypothetical protein [Planctomycetota bacterium]
MRAPSLAAAFALALAVGAPAAGAPQDDAAKAKHQKLRDEILEGAFQDDTRLKAARLLEKGDPELLGATLLELAEGKKNPANLSFLAVYATEIETRLLRTLAIHAAWQSDPTKACARFLEKLPEDDRMAARAVEAAGLIAAAQGDRAAIPKILEVTRTPRILPGIEAARAVNRMMEKYSVKDLVRAGLEAPDNHVRKHIVWAVLDIMEKERDVKSQFEKYKGAKAPVGKNAQECVNIIEDGESKPFVWNPMALKEVVTLWKTGRPKDLQPEIVWKDEEIRARFAAGFRELAKTSPAWGHYARSVLTKITIAPMDGPEIYKSKEKVLRVTAKEMTDAESDWQRSYILARDAGIVFCALLGEPSAGHRGWETAYADVWGYMKTSRQPVGTPVEYIDSKLAESAWPK